MNFKIRSMLEKSRVKSWKGLKGTVLVWMFALQVAFLHYGQKGKYSLLTERCERGGHFSSEIGPWNVEWQTSKRKHRKRETFCQTAQGKDRIQCKAKEVMQTQGDDLDGRWGVRCGYGQEIKHEKSFEVTRWPSVCVISWNARWSPVWTSWWSPVPSVSETASCWRAAQETALRMIQLLGCLPPKGEACTGSSAFAFGLVRPRALG